MNMEAPVLLIFFNRENEVFQVIDAIRKCAPKKIYLASDGGRTEKEHEKVVRLREKVRESINWDCQLECLFSDHNRGCQWGPVTSINWVFEKEDRCIILEDDCVPESTFFEYCNQLLERYADNESVWMISGENYLKNTTMFGNADYTFSLRTDTWGWATWRRAWKKCDFNLRLWPAYKKEELLVHTYYTKVYDELEDMTKQLDNIYKQRDRSIWDYQWRFHMLIHNGLCVIPRSNQIKNIGYGKYATHTKIQKKIRDVPTHKLKIPLRHPSCVMANMDFDKAYGKLLFGDKLRAQIDKRNMIAAAGMVWKHYLKRRMK